MKVAMLGLRAPWGTSGGVEAAVSEIAPRLVEKGVDITVFCRSKYNKYGNAVHQGVRLRSLGTIYTKHLEAIVHTFVALPYAICFADIVHIHATGPALLAWLPRLMGRKVVVTIHAFDHQRSKWGWFAQLALRVGLWSALNFPNRSIVVGEHLKQSIKEKYGYDTVCIPNAAKPTDVHPLSVGEVEGIHSDGYLLFLGRIVPEKGLEKCFDAYRASGISLPFVIVGGNINMPEYLKELRECAPPGVIMVGERFGNAKSALLHHARAFVLPSTVEGFPISALEALANETLCLLSDIPPHRELLSQPKTGKVVKSSEWAEIFSWTEKSERSERQEIAKRGKHHILKTYNWDRITQQTMDLYTELIG